MKRTAGIVLLALITVAAAHSVDRPGWHFKTNKKQYTAHLVSDAATQAIEGFNPKTNRDPKKPGYGMAVRYKNAVHLALYKADGKLGWHKTTLPSMGANEVLATPTIEIVALIPRGAHMHPDLAKEHAELKKEVQSLKKAIESLTQELERTRVLNERLLRMVLSGKHTWTGDTQRRCASDCREKRPRCDCRCRCADHGRRR